MLLKFLSPNHNGSLEHHKHQFCFDDLNCCIAKTLWKIIVARLVVPTIWPIQEGINLTQKEVTSLEEVGLSFDTYKETTLKVYLASNLLVQAIPMCLLWVVIALWGCLMQVVGLQLMVARRWDNLSFSK